MFSNVRYLVFTCGKIATTSLIVAFLISNVSAASSSGLNSRGILQYVDGSNTIVIDSEDFGKLKNNAGQFVSADGLVDTVADLNITVNGGTRDGVAVTGLTAMASAVDAFNSPAYTMCQEGQGVTITWSGLVEYVTVGGYRVLNGGTYKIPANTVIQAIGATTMNWTHSFHTSGGNSGIKYTYTTTEANAIGSLAFGGAEYFTGSIGGVTNKNAVTSTSLSGGNTTSISYLSSTSGTTSVVSDLSYSTIPYSYDVIEFSGKRTYTVNLVLSPINTTKVTVPTTAGATSQTVVTSLPTISADTDAFLSGTPTVTISSYYGGWVTRSGGCAEWTFSASN